MADIMASGYSRVLVYDGTDTSNIRGYLQVRVRRAADAFHWASWRRGRYLELFLRDWGRKRLASSIVHLFHRMFFLLF